ncbi:MAG: hypothetical protein ACI9VI_000992 [Candidatus Azotimanducaceae bacterium]|jgi:hypothetical protein
MNAAFDLAAQNDEANLIVLAAKVAGFETVSNWGHSHNNQVHGIGLDPKGMKIICQQAKKK